MTPIFKGKVAQGKFWADNLKTYNLYLKTFEGREVDVIIRKHVKLRTINQNKLYWLYLKLIEDETGNDSQEIHEYFKRIFLPPRFISVFNREIKIPASTTKLDTKEFTDYIAKIEKMTGIKCPNPEEINLDEFINYV